LEKRLVLSSGNLTVPLGPDSVYGHEIVTVQEYDYIVATPASVDVIHPYGIGVSSSFGIFDTGSSVISFSAQDQTFLTTENHPIPIQIFGGASAQGIGGTVVGNVSEPGTVFANGLTAASVSITAQGNPEIGPSIGSNSAQVPNLQVFVGTETGSPLMPTLTGTPILLPSPANPNGLAADVYMDDALLNLTSLVPGLSVAIPNLDFVRAGTPLMASNTTGLVQVPLTLSGGSSDPSVSGAVTEAPVPILNGLTLSNGNSTQGGQRFLLDTGAQMTIISTATAEALGLDLSHPITTAKVEGIGGSEQVPGFTIKELDVPDLGGTLRFLNVPVFVLNVANGADGVLGMNILDSATAMQYDPYNSAGPLLSLYFGPATSPATSIPVTGTPGSGSTGGNGLTPTSNNLPFGSAINGTNVPFLQVNSARISGSVFLDFNHNGVQDSGEPGLAGVTVYIDLNHDGQLDSGDPTTVTGADGSYQFINLSPGSYSIREILTPSLVNVPGFGGPATGTAQDDSTMTANFGVDRIEPDPQTAFISSLYGDILDRAPDVAGLEYFEQMLNGGASPTQVVSAIWQSSEHRELQIDDYYQTFLNRQADSSGMAYWLNLFLSGASESAIQLGFATSGEFLAAHPGNASYLSALYNDLLGRAIDPSGAAFFSEELASGTSRPQVVQQILGSGEFCVRTIDGYYATLLHRPADLGGRQAWLNLLQNNQISQDGVAEAFLASQEYLLWTREFSES